MFGIHKLVRELSESIGSEQYRRREKRFQVLQKYGQLLKEMISSFLDAAMEASKLQAYLEISSLDYTLNQQLEHRM